MSWTRLRGTRRSAFASWAMTSRSPSAATTSSGPSHGPTSTRSPVATAKRHVSVSANSSPSGGAGARTATATSASTPSAATSASVPARTRAEIVCSATGAGAAASSSPNASSRRWSGVRSSNSRKTSRSFERSGGRAASAIGSTSTGTSRLIVASTLLTRASSECSVRFCLRLAPEMSSMWSRTLSSDAELLQELRRRLVADARDARDVVRRVALEAVEVGDQVRRDPVALDDRGVVVDLRVGDPAARRHHAHARVGIDDLEGVAVAGDDHHGHVLVRGRARRSRR